MHEFQKYLKTLNISPRTIRGYLSDLKKAQDCNIIINPDRLLLNLSVLFNLKLSPQSKRRIRASLRKYGNFLIQQGKLDRIPPELDTMELPKPVTTLPKMADLDKIKIFIESTKDKELKTILLILYTTACRISSLADLKIEDISDTSITFTTAKGNKPYITILTNETKEAIEDYLKNRKRSSDYLFTRKNGSKITADGIRMKMMRKMGKDYCNPHSLRHRRATELIENGIDLLTVKTFLNHDAIATTEKYVHLTSGYISNKLGHSVK